MGIFQRKKSKEEIEQAEKKKVLPKRKSILDKFYEERDELRKIRDNQIKLHTGVLQLLVDYPDTMDSVSLYMESADLIFNKKEDMPCDIFCKVQTLGLFATLEQIGGYNVHSVYTIYDEPDPIKYKLHITVV